MSSARADGTLGRGNRSDVYAVTSGAGAVMDASLTTAAATEVALLAPDGRLLDDATIRDEEGETSFGSWPVAAGATYLLLVEWSTGVDVPYSLSTAVVEARPVSPGAKAEGELSRPSQLVAFRVDAAQAGDVSILVAPQPELDLYVRVIRPDGTPLIEHDTGGAGQEELFTVTAPAAGPYLVVAASESSGHDTGRFEVAVTGGG